MFDIPMQHEKAEDHQYFAFHKAMSCFETLASLLPIMNFLWKVRVYALIFVSSSPGRKAFMIAKT